MGIPLLPSAPILVIDPSEDSSQDCARALQSLGYQVDRASTFKDALVLLSAAPYCAAIIELTLPDTLGTDAWHHVSQSYPPMYCILTTTSASLHQNIRLDGARLLDFMLKPLDMERVNNLLSRVVSEQMH